MKKLPYSIMSGSGNTFVVADYREGGVPGFIRLSDLARKEGVDGLLLLEESSAADFKIRIINPDGSEAEMCGNGARCIAKFARMQGITQDTMVFETLAGLIQAMVLGDRVKLRMTDPLDIRLDKELSLDGRVETFHFINTGVPHTILLGDELSKIDVEGIGRTIRFHPDFRPEGTNVDFVRIIDRGTIEIRTYERGVEGETLACGTGAAAGACIAYLLGRVDPPVRVLPQSQKSLMVYFEYRQGKITNLFLEGEVKSIREGEV